MIRSELVELIAQENPHLTRADAERIVSVFFQEITDAMARGGRVELRGFGAFSVRNRDGRTGRNPRTGENVEVAPKTFPFFKAGKEIKERLQDAARKQGAIPEDSSD